MYSFPGRFLSIPLETSVEAEEVQSWVRNGAGKKQDELWKLMEENLCNLESRGEKTFLLGTHSPTVLDIIVLLVVHYGPGWPDDRPKR